MTDRLSMVVCEGTFDKAMMPLILGTTAASMGSEVNVFYTFFGTKLLKKGVKPKMPGMMRFFTGMMIGRMKKMGIPDYDGMMNQAMELGINFYACSTTLGLMGISEADLRPGVKVLGAAAFIEKAQQSNVNLFIG